MDIARDIERAKDHPSPFVRAAYERWTQAECDKYAGIVRGIAHDGQDGKRAWRIIHAWYTSTIDLQLTLETIDC